MAASTIMWLDEATEPAESSRSGRIRTTGAWGWAGDAAARMHLARAGATRMTVACLGAPGIQARELYYGVGFRLLTRDAPLIKPAAQGQATT